VSARTLAVVVALTGLFIIAIGIGVMYGGGPPPAPPRPKIPEPAVTAAALRYSATIYRAALEQDAHAFGIPPTPYEEMAKPFTYFDEWSGDRALKVGAVMETPHLHLQLVVRKEAGTMAGQLYRADHMVLTIQNRSDGYLAYRIQTRVPDEPRCETKGDAPHNAIVLAPHQTIRRTECLYRSDERITVRRIEVMEIPPLGAYYVSRMPPGLILYGRRTSAGHVPLAGSLCPQTFSWRDIRDGADRGELGWRDVIDFYARHNCEEYSFFRSYRHRTGTDEPLPARPPEIEAAQTP
jgi:hypothetical protein